LTLYAPSAATEHQSWNPDARADLQGKGADVNEHDAYAMLSARCMALEQIALEAFCELCAPLSEDVCKQRLEAAIEAIAPGCGTRPKG
jgi:hypothetical protein